MRRLYYLLLCCTAAGMLIWFAGCSTDQSSTVNGPAASATEGVPSDEEIVVSAADAILGESPDETRQEVSVICCVSPYVQCLSATDTSLTIRICAGLTGAPGGFKLQWAPVPVGLTCTAFPFPQNSVPTIFIPGPVAAYACRQVTITGLACGTQYSLRGFAINQYGCLSPPSSRLCCTTNECEEQPPCFDPPVVSCYDATETSLTVRVCAGASGAPGGVTVKYQPVAAGVFCGNVAWPTTGLSSFTTGPLAANACVYVTVSNLTCETTYAFHGKANAYGPNCVSVFSPNVCCTTDDCEELPCVDMPAITCLSSTDTSITVQVCAGPSGAPAGVKLQHAPIGSTTACAAFVWPATGVASVTTAPLAANACATVTIYGLACETSLVFRAQGLACQPFPCPSDWTANLCCTTNACEQLPCLDTPTVECWSRTDNSLTLKICAGPSGAPCGLVLKGLALPPLGGTVATVPCAGVDWSVGGVQTTAVAALAANACTYVTINNLDCETVYAFKVKALAGCSGYTCESGFSSVACCMTDDCEELPCLDVPAVTCLDATDNSLTIRICAGPTGAPCGITLKLAEMPENGYPDRTNPTECASFVWPGAGVHSYSIGALGPNACKDTTISGLNCERSYALKAKALAGCNGYECPSDFSANVCCYTDECEQLPCADLPTITCYDATETSITIQVCAGPGGAPAGVKVWRAVNPLTVSCGSFSWPATGLTHMTTGPLASNACTYLTFSNLTCEQIYAFRAQALACASCGCPSELTEKLCCETEECEEVPGGCTLTQGFWKNHPEDWPVLSLTIGSVNYTQLQLIAALQRSSAGGNALVILAKQLIAAKLNILNGADGSAVAATIAQADALIGALSITTGSVASNTALGQQMVAKAAILDNYNNGRLNVPHCPS